MEREGASHAKCGLYADSQRERQRQRQQQRQQQRERERERERETETETEREREIDRERERDQEWPRQTKPKKGQFMNFSQGHAGTEVQCELCLFS